MKSFTENVPVKSVKWGIGEHDPMNMIRESIRGSYSWTLWSISNEHPQTCTLYTILQLSKIRNKLQDSERKPKKRETKDRGKVQLIGEDASIEADHSNGNHAACALDNSQSCMWSTVCETVV